MSMLLKSKTLIGWYLHKNASFKILIKFWDTNFGM